jgi:hypothetical protein
MPMLDRPEVWREIADRRYVLQVEASNVRGNPNVASLVVTFVNGQ